MRIVDRFWFMCLFLTVSHELLCQAVAEIFLCFLFGPRDSHTMAKSDSKSCDARLYLYLYPYYYKN